jgi:hypothetical protein
LAEGHQNTGVVDRRSFEIDPDATVHFDADPDPDCTPGFTHVGKIRFFSYFYSQQCQFYLSYQRYRCQNFQYFGLSTVLNFSREKYSLVLRLDIMNTDPDPDQRHSQNEHSLLDKKTSR